MSAEIADVRDGIVAVKVSGTLTQSEFAGMQTATAEIIRAQGKVRILILADQFAGWEQGGAWDDFAFQEQFDPCIEKMAIVGDKRWEDLATLFTAKGLRPFPIEYFATGELGKARAWLAGNP